jgi:hypothetical protein
MASTSARVLAFCLVGPVLAAGRGLLVVAAGTGVERALLVRSSSSADGIVVALGRIPGSTKKFVAPIVRFAARSGLSYTISSSIYDAPSKWRRGDHVSILY